MSSFRNGTASCEKDETRWPEYSLVCACRGLDGRMKFAVFVYDKHFQAYQKNAFALVGEHMATPT